MIIFTSDISDFISLMLRSSIFLFVDTKWFSSASSLSWIHFTGDFDFNFDCFTSFLCWFLALSKTYFSIVGWFTFVEVLQIFKRIFLLKLNGWMQPAFSLDLFHKYDNSKIFISINWFACLWNKCSFVYFWKTTKSFTQSIQSKIGSGVCEGMHSLLFHSLIEV